jgi:hypothetical protein
VTCNFDIKDGVVGIICSGQPSRNRENISLSVLVRSVII